MTTFDKLINLESFKSFYKKVKQKKFTLYYSMYKDLRLRLEYSQDPLKLKHLVYLIFNYSEHSSFGIAFELKEFLKFEIEDIKNLYKYGIILNRYYMLVLKGKNFEISPSDQKHIDMVRNRYISKSILN